MSETPQILLAHHLKKLKLPTFLREYDKIARLCASEGTDHGAAAPLFVAGHKVRAGLVGKHPSLTDLDDGDLKFHTDYRQVYATVLEDWLGCSSEPLLGRFDKLTLFG